MLREHCHAGPCYRCLFPEAPEPQSCSRCSDAGVLGVVPGIMGSLQVLHTPPSHITASSEAQSLPPHIIQHF